MRTNTFHSLSAQTGKLLPFRRQLSDPSRSGTPAGDPLKYIKRVLVMVVGGTVLAIGVALVALPGPAFIVIPAGLAILAIEFAWARRWLNKARGLLRKGDSVERTEAI